MECSKPNLPPASSSQQLTVTSADVSSAGTSKNALYRVALCDSNFISAITNGSYSSFHVTHRATQTSSLNPPHRSSQPSFALPTVSILPQTATSMSICFQKLVPKLQATKLDGDSLNWFKWFSVFQATIDPSPMSSGGKKWLTCNHYWLEKQKSRLMTTVLLAICTTLLKHVLRNILEIRTWLSMPSSKNWHISNSQTWQSQTFIVNIFNDKCRSNPKKAINTSPRRREQARSENRFVSTISERAFGVVVNLRKIFQRSNHFCCISSSFKDL